MNLVLIILYSSLVVTIASSFVTSINRTSNDLLEGHQTIVPPSVVSSGRSLGVFEVFLNLIQTGLTMLFGRERSTSSGRKSRGSKVSYRGFQVLRVYPKDDDEVDELESIRDDAELAQFWTKPMKKMPVDMLVSPDALDDSINYLRGKDIDYDTLMYDVQKLISYENPRMTKDQRDILLGRQGHPFTWSRYHRYGDMIRYMEFLVYTYPDLVELNTIGYTSNGLPLKVMKVSSDVQSEDMEPGEMKPAVWIDGGMHGREWISPSVVLYILRQLVEKYEKHKKLVDSADWYFLPVANPDGYEYSHTTDRLWSKTRSNHDNSAAVLATKLIYGACEGVTLDHNFDFHWGEFGISDDPCSEFYAGPRPYSEPEAKAISDFILDKRGQLEMLLSLHSYSQRWLIPWSYSRKKAENHNEMMSLARKAVQAIKRVTGVEYEVGPTSQFEAPSSGSFTDWAKATVGVKHTYKVQLRDTGNYGYLLPATEIIPTAKEIFVAVKNMAKTVVCKS